MKLKPKGRKIYRQKTRFERLRAFKSNTGAVISTVLLAGILGFVGYSAGGPVLEFLQERKVLPVPGQTEATESVSAASLPEIQETVLPEEPETASTELQTEPVTESVPTAPQAPEFRGYLLPVSALSGETALAEAIAAVPEGATHVLIPLKTAGGSLYYGTTLEDAVKAGAVRAVMPLELIYETASAGGAEPVAVVNTLEDSIYPASFSLAAYRIAGSDEIWTDAPEGKPRLSPFSDLTLDYMANLAGEIADAGFTSIVCEGLRFPAFSEEELNRLDPRCSTADRYTGLANVVKAMQEAAPEAAFYVETEGVEALTSGSDALAAAEQLELEAVMVKVSAAIRDKSDQLRNLTTVHPTILIWDGTDTEIPPEETSFVQAVPLSPETGAAED